MNEMRLKNQIVDGLWRVVDRYPFIQSATLTGSFATSDTLEGLSDIDFVLIVDELNRERFEWIQQAFDAELRPILAQKGYDFQINPTLGPLKFNAPNLAVLHLMLYTTQSHVEHVIQSPFTCLDWQRSSTYRGHSMSEIYPTFGLQPRHFVSARRSISDYLRDFRDSVVSYREFHFEEAGYREVKQAKPMTVRDRHEFAYHVMRFLMLNLLKLVRVQSHELQSLDGLLNRFHQVFPKNAELHTETLHALADKKRRIDFEHSLDGLDGKLESFIQTFEQQFRDQFFERARRHVVFRHAATEMNLGPVRFVGRSDPSIVVPRGDSRDWERLQKTVVDAKADVAYVSPLKRTQETMQVALVPNPKSLPFHVDERIIEMNYGDCEGRTVSECRQAFPELFDAWSRSEDPCFPGGESSAMVLARSLAFASERWGAHEPVSLTCTHNVVLRSLIGHAMCVPPSQRHRLRIPHLAPITIVSTPDFGWFVELDEGTEREIFADFQHKIERAVSV